MAAYEIARQTNLRVLMIERIKRLHDSREVANGFMGGSSRSDVKLFLTPGFGGEIQNHYCIADVLEVLEGFGRRRIKVSKKRLTDKQLEWLKSFEVEVDEPEVAEVGSEHLGAIEKALHSWLLKHVDFRSNCGLLDLVKEESRFRAKTTVGEFTARYCVLAMGRGGTRWIADKKMGAQVEQTGYDLGVRIEVPQVIMSDLTGRNPNFRLRWGDFRTTTISEFGTVELENVYGVQTSNGRTMAGRETSSSNFGLLRAAKSKAPLQEMTRAAQIVNVLADNQLFKESPSKLLNGTSQLNYLPEFVAMKEGLEKIFEIWPAMRGRASLYAPEARLNAGRVKTTAHMETSVQGLYCCGDMGGQTKSFMQAACSGLLAGRHIVCQEVAGL